MQESWVLNIQKQCEEQGVAFFFKQWGTWGAMALSAIKKKMAPCLAVDYIGNIRK